jgi:hypothetical protein
MSEFRDRLILLLKTEITPRPTLEQQKVTRRIWVRAAIFYLAFMMVLVLLTVYLSQRITRDVSARGRGFDDGEESYRSGERHLVEADVQGRSGFSGRKVDTFEVWNWPCKRSFFPLSLVLQSPTLGERNYVKGYNEGVCKGSSRNADKNLRKVIAALQAFHDANRFYAAMMNELCKGNTPFLEATWTGSVDGYTFSTAGASNAFTINADPTVQDVTGTTHYFADASGRTWYSNHHKASTSDAEDFSLR